MILMIEGMLECSISFINLYCARVAASSELVACTGGAKTGLSIDRFNKKGRPTGKEAAIFYLSTFIL
jgi:hypothetical protein